MPTLSRLFLDRVAQTPDRVAHIAFVGDAEAGAAPRDFTWREYEELARAFGLGLVDLGVRRGDVVAILAQTRHEWAYCDVGAIGVGAVTVGLYPTLAPDGVGSMHFVIDHSEARVLVVESAETLRTKIAPILGKISRIEHIVVWDDAEAAKGLDPRVVSLDDVLARGRARHERDGEAWRRACEEAEPSDLALIVYTSGTTGNPKGAMLTHGNVVALTRSATEIFPPPTEDGPNGVSFLPMAHAAERCVHHYLRIHVGGASFFARSLETLMEDVARAKPRRFGSVPRIFEKVYARVMGEIGKLPEQGREMARAAISAAIQASRNRRENKPIDDRTKMMAAMFDQQLGARVRGIFGGRCTWFVCGAAPVAIDILELFDACGMPTYEVYGLTETTGLLTGNRPGAQRYGTVGKPLPGVELRIADDGEILARGANVFAGYLKDAQATAECMHDGWFHTGDIGTIDADGFVRITDRKKNILITAGGKNITPSNIENAVTEDPMISYCHLHADRRPYPTALVCLDAERLRAFSAEKSLSGATAEALANDATVRAHVQAAIDRANARFARFEQIRKFAILPRELSIDGGELTPTLKVKRREVESRYRSVLDALYASEG